MVVCEKCHVGASYEAGPCVQREWVVGGGGLYLITSGNRDSKLASRSDDA